MNQFDLFDDTIIRVDLLSEQIGEALQIFPAAGAGAAGEFLCVKLRHLLKDIVAEELDEDGLIFDGLAMINRVRPAYGHQRSEIAEAGILVVYYSLKRVEKARQKVLAEFSSYPWDWQELHKAAIEWMSTADALCTDMINLTKVVDDIFYASDEHFSLVAQAIMDAADRYADEQGIPA